MTTEESQDKQAQRHEPGGPLFNDTDGESKRIAELVRQVLTKTDLDQDDAQRDAFDMLRLRARAVLDPQNEELKLKVQNKEEEMSAQARLRQMEAEETANLQDEDYLAWEPLTPIQKIHALFFNTLEVTFITAVAILALQFPSMISLGLLILSLPLLLTQTAGQRKRWSQAACILLLNQLAIGAVVAWKVHQLNTLVLVTSDLTRFKHQIRFNEFLGFKVNMHLSNSTEALQVYEIKDVDYVGSVMAEAVFSILTIITMTLVCQQIRRVNYFSDVLKIQERKEKHKDIVTGEEYEVLIVRTHKENIERLQLLIDDPFEKEKVQEHKDALKKDMKPGELANLKTKEAERLRRLGEELKQLRKQVCVTFVDSHFFFRQTTKFLVLLLLTVLIEAMTFNSSSDIPALLLIAVMAAFYPVRKTYSVFYRVFSFIVVYFVMLLMLLKIFYEIVSQIKFISDTLKDKEYANYQSVQFVAIVFGVQHSAASSDGAIVLSSTIFCFVCCCWWRTAKWVEIRSKTKHTPNLSSFGQLKAYFLKRSNEDDLEQKLRQNKDVNPQERKKVLEALEKRKLNARRSKHVWLASESAAKKSLQDFQKYVPHITLWMTRLNLFCLAYAYHTFAGIFPLLWIICSFTLPARLVLLLSSLVMAPAFTVGFFIVYCSKIPLVSDTEFFKSSVFKHLAWDMENPILEQSLLYFTLAVFLMMLISSSVSTNKKVTKQIEDVAEDAEPGQSQIAGEISDLGNREKEGKSKTKEENQLLTFFTKRIREKRFSNKWKVLFLLTKYIQTGVLLAVFMTGVSALEEYKSLGFMVFFIIYTAYESVYRKTSFLLVIWIAFFILERYCKSLVCHQDNVSSDLYAYLKTNNTCAALLTFWEKLNTKPVQVQIIDGISGKEIHKVRYDVCATEPQTSMYFRTLPSPTNWLILVAMSLLSSLNTMHLHDPEEVGRLTQECVTKLRDKNEKLAYYLNRVKGIVMGTIIYIILIAMIFIQGYLETNIINYVFFILNSLSLSTLIKGEHKVGSLRRSHLLATSIKIYSLAVNLSQIAFFILFGDSEPTTLLLLKKSTISSSKASSNKVESLNEWLYRTQPTLYELLPYIGFRHSKLDAKDEDVASAAKTKFKNMYLTYITFFLLSLYLIWHFEMAIKISEGEAEFRELHYKKIFEFRTKDQVEKQKEHAKKKREHQRRKMLRAGSTSPKAGARGPSLRAAIVGKAVQSLLTAQTKELLAERVEIHEDGADAKSGRFKKKKVYEQNDFVDFYEQTRFSLPFMVYRSMDNWPIYDFIATYGHIVNNLAVIYVATTLNVNFYMFFNVCCVCYFYSVASARLSGRADALTSASGLQAQVDVRLASMLSEGYRKQASHEFLKLRRKIWYIQFMALLVVVWVGFPTELLYHYRKNEFPEVNEKSNVSNQDYVQWGNTLKLVDDISFWLFFFGFYKDSQRVVIDGREEYASIQTYWITICSLLIGLILERQAISWLKNRFGCNHYKLQKFIELDMRRGALSKDRASSTWEVCPPVYDVERYRQHYFENDFDELKEKFTINTEVEAGQKDSTTIGDFVPYEKAITIRETIRFSILIDGRCSSVKQDAQAKKLLGSQQVKIVREKPDQIKLSFTLAYHEKVPDGYALFVVGDVGDENPDEIKDQNLQDAPYIIKDQMTPVKADPTLWSYQCVIKDQNTARAEEGEILDIKQKKLAELPLLVYKYCLVEAETGKITWEKTCNRSQNVQIQEVEQYSLEHHGTADVFDSWQAGRVQPYNYESVPILKAFKLQQLQQILKQAVSFKYKTSFFKGLKYLFENLVLLLLLVSIVVKSNFYSILYLVFVFRFVMMKNKDVLIVKANAYMAFLFALQYFLYLINLTANSSPQQFPRGFLNYPRNVDQQQNPITDDFSIRLGVPVFFRYKVLQNFQLAFLLGLGVDKHQLYNLIFDFVNLYLISMYILTFRNPIYNAKVRKIFWQYPTPNDSKQWQRLDEIVQRQVLWLYSPIKLEVLKDQGGNLSQLTPQQIANADAQHFYAMLYCKLNKYDLNYHLTTYVDLKDSEVWSEAHLKTKKHHIKMNSSYYRIVKQGSQFAYLTLHIFTIFAVLLVSIIRTSVISLGYVFLLLPHLRAAAEVLDQRQINVNRLREDYKKKQEKLIALQGKYKPIEKEYKDITVELIRVEENLQNLQQDGVSLAHDQKDDQRKKSTLRRWSILSLMQVQILAYSIFDFTCNTLIQLPVIPAAEVEGGLIQHFVTGKIWKFGDNIQSYSHWVNYADRSETAIFIAFDGLAGQCLICFTVFIVVLQSDIFNSPGYTKFVTQIGGSMDGFMKLSEDKAKIITQIFNNYKIKKILSLQKKRETIMATVQRMKEKLINWRRFTRTKLAENTDVNNEQMEPEPIEESRNRNRRGGRSEEYNVRQELKQKQSSLLEKKFAKSNSDLDEKNLTDTTKHIILSPEEMDEVIDEIAHLFTKSKMKKMRATVRLYQWLNSNFTEQAMFKSSKAELDDVSLEVSQGGTSIYTELEDIMWVESRELVRAQYCDLAGRRDLALIRLEQKQHKSDPDAADDFLLQITGMDKKVKLKDMPKTWEFTRSSAMALRLTETFVCICVSNTHNFIYLAMVFNMYINAGLLSLFYPIMAFGRGMLEETRPRKEFWDTVRNYNIFLLIMKLLLGIELVQEYLKILSAESGEGDEVQRMLAYLKIGFANSMSLVEQLQNVLPEVLLTCLIMFNEIKLKLAGLYYQTEEDIENIQDGILRVELDGNQRAVEDKKLEDSYMYLSRYFDSVERQKQRSKAAIEALKEEINVSLRRKQEKDLKNEYGTTDRNKIVEQQFQKEYADTRSLEDKQKQLLCEISEKVRKGSKEFDMDLEAENSPWDYLVSQTAIQKTLESDNLIFLEGARRQSQPQFMSEEQFKDEKLKTGTSEAISACDHEDEFLYKFDEIDYNLQPDIGFFEKSAYFSALFPSSKVQKPGYDLYGSTTLVLGLVAGYVFYCFSQYTADPGIFDWIAGQSSIFKGDFALTLLAIIVILIVERYANRTDTKGQQQGREKLDIAGDPETGNQVKFFNDDEIFKRSQTSRQLTVGLKTIQKTIDFNVKGESEQKFLKSLRGQDEDKKLYSTGRNLITNQQKTKYILHWFILIAGHFYVFWYIPISGNTQLHNGPVCRAAAGENKCYDFERNAPLKLLYILIVLYLTLSSLQVRYGFPTLKKPSSVLNNYNNLQQPLAQVYQAFPFAVELRCLLDFTFSKTSLDLFQFFQLWQYHYEMYNAKVSNNYLAHKKVLGSRQVMCDKCLFGVLFTTIILGLMAGPFLLFSEYGGLVAPNPVLKGDLTISLLINSTYYLNNTDPANPGEYITIPFNVTDEDLYSDKFLPKSISNPYLIYADDNMYINTFTDSQWLTSNFSKAAETKSFVATQVQAVSGSQYSDDKWLATDGLKDQLYADLKVAANNKQNARFRNVTLQLNMMLERAEPASNKFVPVQMRKELDYQQVSDCISGQQLREIKNLDCENNRKDKKYVIFRKALINEMVLGQTGHANIINVTKDYDLNWLDILLEINCQESWIVRANQTNTKDYLTKSVDSSKCYKSEDYECKYWNEPVDPETCLPILDEINQKNISKEKSVQEMLRQKQNQFEKEQAEYQSWDPISFYVFSMLVSSSFLASMTPLTFYTGFLVLLQPSIRTIFLFNTFKAKVYEVVDPDAVIRLVEACYIYRHECDLVAEEEVYRMIIEILRSPELYKAVSGTSLKGTTDPALDALTKADKNKYLALEKLEQKGFDVAKLKKKFIHNNNKNSKEIDAEKIPVYAYP